MAPLSLVQLLAELENLAAAPPAELLADSELRAKLHNASRRAALALEQPTEVVVRLLLANPVESAIVNIALKLELFAKVASVNDEPQSFDALVAATGADGVLLKRILSSLAAFGAVKEVAGDAYTLSPSYKSLANPAFGYAVVECANFLNPTYQALPALLASTCYQDPTDPKNTAVQKAFGYVDTDLIGILTEKPQAGRGFGMLMSSWGEGHAMLQHLYPVTEKLVDSFDENCSPVTFVDVGGGYGQRAIALKDDFPQFPGKVIVQDLAMSIEHAPKVDGIEFQVHNFFTEQPIKDAKAYYIRQCLHNWPDDICIQIIRHLGDAMKPGYSKLLIHEQIMPERGAGQWVSIQDINMMALCGVAERTEKTWRDIIAQAGLTLEALYLAKDGVSESVLEAVKA